MTFNLFLKEISKEIRMLPNPCSMLLEATPVPEQEKADFLSEYRLIYVLEQCVCVSKAPSLESS